MKKIITLMLLISVFFLTIALPQASAQLADGSHSIQYQVNKPDSNSASIANDYFVKPAKVTVTNGVATVQITLKNSTWITKFQPLGGATVVNEDKVADTRTVQFTVKDLSKPIVTAMKIDIDDINYHHEYSVALVFNGAASTGGAAKTDGAKASTPAGTESQVPNPQTGDATPYVAIAALVGSAFLLYRKKQQTKMEA
ncbi:heme uptake protein IsdC [Lysinibacillus piscis]|uniref:Heme uptake protein IsdC n=1 Tax=Lysinibacillus piscis TaxID=2518931 RepID=A0ABQ5NI33_9BACI|nr:heme uptake protein IsdC [Lysinibacillus sp. KH24]GLC87709.1 heme uptake protein IsdC [Lysinibacillus sp. KH24]